MQIPRVYCDVAIGLLCITQTKSMLQKANALGRYVLYALFQVWQHKYGMWVVSVWGSTSVDSYINDRNVKQKLNSSHHC